ncbi:MAG: tyrosine-type recombinase/integrase [Methanotrichaceae archaeon]|nr:tyrosine-type recombinase/integrase [Methanotrichaceae archaeon]
MKSNSELIEMFKNDCEIRGLADQTISSYVIKTQAFLNWLDGRNLLEIDRSILKDYINYLRKKNLKDKSFHTIFDAIGAMFSFLEDEGLIVSNPVPKIRQRYLPVYKRDAKQLRQLISIEDASRFVNSIRSSRDRATATLMFKTGIRISELVNLDLDSIDWKEQSITLKPTKKRSNRVVFFDNECARVLQLWIDQRKTWNATTPALFIDKRNNRIRRDVIERWWRDNAEELGLYKIGATELKDKFTPHCCRHWFSAHLRKAGMPNEFIQELRGDVRREAIALYDHIDLNELKESYQIYMPKLGIRSHWSLPTNTPARS